MARLEKFGLVFFSIILTLLLTNFLVVNYRRASADSVIFVDLLNNISIYGKPESQVATTTQDFLFNKDNYLTIKAEDLSKLSFSIPAYKELNFFRFHLYLILYLLIPFTWIIPPFLVTCFFIALSFVGLMVLLYLYLRTKKINIFSSLLFCALIMAHPAWNFSILGQLYPDRYFLVLGFGLMWLLESKLVKFRWLLVVSLLSAIIVEKLTIMVGLIVVGFSILYRKNLKTFVLGLFILILGLLVIKFYILNGYYSSFISVEGVLGFVAQLMENPKMASNLLVFLIVNLPLLLVGLFEPKACIIAIGTMIPNILGNIGGAEKTGWITHYHSIYFPILVWASAYGYVNILNSNRSRRFQILVVLILMVITFMYVGVQPFSLKEMKFNVENVKKNSLFLVKNIGMFTLSKKGTNLYDENLFDEVIPKGSTVSCPESVFVLVYEDRIVYYYPIGIDSVDYVILNNNNGNYEVPYRGFVSYIGEKNALDADKYLLNRMKLLGYDVNNPIKVGNLSVFKREIRVVK